MRALSRQVSGHWAAGANAGNEAVTVDVRAGRLYTITPAGAELEGPPQEFICSSGESGDSLLALVVDNPDWCRLFRGAVREAVGTVSSTARFGVQETRAWEEGCTYVVDDNEGSAAVARFSRHGAIAAISGHEFTRPFDPARAVSHAPEAARGPLLELCELPLLGGRERITAVFWTEGALLTGAEAWHETYLFGAEIFRRELLRDTDWKAEGARHHDLTPELTQLAIDISVRANIAGPVADVSGSDLDRLVPADARFRADALELLACEEAFRLARE
jgi:hypothetical protein